MTLVSAAVGFTCCAGFCIGYAFFNHVASITQLRSPSISRHRFRLNAFLAVPIFRAPVGFIHHRKRIYSLLQVFHQRHVTVIHIDEIIHVCIHCQHIRRIGVIQLSDKSTVIVHEPQLISQNARNATMGNSQGVVTLLQTFPLRSDPVQGRNILLSVYSLHESVM